MLDRPATNGKQGKVDLKKAPPLQDFGIPPHLLPADARVKESLLPSQPTASATPDSQQPSPRSRGLWGSFKDLPIQRKLLVLVGATGLVSLAGLASSIVIISLGGTKALESRAEAELAVVALNYNIKVNQTAYGFRGQSDNTALIEAAKTGQTNPTVKAILMKETRVRDIEFATLVDKNKRIIETAGSTPKGSLFDPAGLVSQVLTAKEQLISTEVISFADLQREQPEKASKLGSATATPSFLIRYTATPVFVGGKDLVGVLISGDVVSEGKTTVNNYTTITEGSVTALNQGFAALTVGETPSLGNILVKEEVTPTSELPSELVQQALSTNNPAALNIWRELGGARTTALIPGTTVVGTTRLNGKTYTLAAAPILNLGGTPVGTMVRGIDHQELNLLILEEELLVVGVGTLSLIVGLILAQQIGKRIAQPLVQLSQVAGQYAQGELTVRAEVDSADEVGQLADNFNQMATNIVQRQTEQAAAQVEILRQEQEIARQQQEAAREQQEAKEFLQNRALELLMEVSPLRQGDLTIRAKVTEDEIGTIADSYNATINSLRKIAVQVQEAAQKVSGTTSTNETSVRELAQEALEQADAIQIALSRIADMNRSIQEVALSAQQAEQAVQTANQTVQQGDQAMNRTVEGILTIRETVAETAKKVKQLGESSQKISKVVNLIGTFAAQTNLLALNASIEAARAGEEGRGFAVVADEVRSLARQSAQATSEIEHLVANIQSETNEVVAAMEAGTEQVVAGTRLVEETRQSLVQIVQVSQQISQFVQSITQATSSQTRASEQVAGTMTEVAGVAETTSSRAKQVLEAFQDLLTVAQDLQSTAGQFKLN
jgi:twitching motility protein PilJ